MNRDDPWDSETAKSYDTPGTGMFAPDLLRRTVDRLVALAGGGVHPFVQGIRVLAHQRLWRGDPDAAQVACDGRPDVGDVLEGGGFGGMAGLHRAEFTPATSRSAGVATALLQRTDELAHVRAQGCEQVVGVLAVVEHQPAQQLGADDQRGTLVAAEAALALDVLENAHPVVMAGVFEFDGAAAIALQAIVLDGRDGDAVAVGVVGHGGVRRWRGGDHGQDRRARQP